MCVCVLEVVSCSVMWCRVVPCSVWCRPVKWFVWYRNAMLFVSLNAIRRSVPLFKMTLEIVDEIVADVGQSLVSASVFFDLYVLAKALNNTQHQHKHQHKHQHISTVQ